MTKSIDRVPRLQDLNIKIFSDGADLDSIIEAYNKGIVKGFTTNPTLMAKAGITNYLMFAEEVLRVVNDLSVSFEVFSDDFDEMREQALRLAALADNVYVKIPVTNTERKSAAPLIKDLSHRGLKLNVTAIMSLRQVEDWIRAGRVVVNGRPAELGQRVGPGDRIVARGSRASFPAGPALLGRVIDALGQPLDDLGPLRGTVPAPLLGVPVNPLAREPKRMAKSTDGSAARRRGRTSRPSRRNGSIRSAMPSASRSAGRRRVHPHVPAGQRPRLRPPSSLA
jgi:hypothetical protein